MKLDAFGLANRSLFFLRERGSAQLDKEISDARAKFAVLDDAELTAMCHSALQGRFEVPGVKSTGVMRTLLRLSGYRRDDDAMTHLVALGVEAFRRAPADLPAGSALFLEQIRAAAALTTKTLVEMNTGEGKTYAILPAAFALCCALRRVYVVCASEYLAWRDASRTAAFWNRVGVSVGFAVNDTQESEWNARVVYTTLESLIFKAMRDTIASQSPKYPVTYDALLLDEADAILLDQAAQPYSIISPLKASTYDWSAAFAFCDQIKEEEHIVVNRTDLSASLTEQGEAMLRAFGGADTSPAQFLLLRHAAELAYIALKVAREDVDFIAEGGRLHPVNRLTGRIERHVTPTWIIPLEGQRGLPARPVNIDLIERSASSFVSEFEHISGTSGTILEDGVEFLLTYGLLSMRVEPRYPRHDGDAIPLVYRTKGEAHAAIVARAVESHQARRPVLVGCQTPADAEAIYMKTRQAAPDAQVTLLTGRDDQNTAKVFENAGQPDSIVVATQIAGRGVDIRLSEESRANGGLDLLCAGHSLQRRHDRQFFGRAGRQGDPYTATFYCSLDDELLVMVGSRRIQSVMQRLGMEEGVPIESKMVESAMRRTQRELMYRRFVARRANQFLARGEGESHAAIADWFSRLQASRTETPTDIDDEFIDNVVSRFIDSQPVLQDTRDLVDEVAAIALAKSLVDVAGAEHPPFLTARDLDGHTQTNAKKVIKSALLKEMQRRLSTHRATMAFEDRAMNAHLAIYQLEDFLESKLRTSEGEDGATTVPDSLTHFDTAALRKIEELQAMLKTLAAGDPPAGGADNRFAILTAADRIAALCEGIRAAAAADPNRADVEPLRAELREALAHDDVGLWKRWRVSQRNLRQIVYWSIQWVWIEYLEERDRIRDRYAQGDLSPYDYYRAVADRSHERWKELEEKIPEKIIRHLMAAECPSSLDQLFLLEDHTGQTENQPRPLPLAWSPNTAFQPQQSETSADIVDRFITVHQSRLTAPMTSSSLRRLFDDFLRDHPIESLASPRQIQNALEAWSVREVENGVESRRRKLRRRWLGDFLEFLRGERRISGLPTLRHRLVSFRRRTLRRLGNVHTLLPVTAGTILVGLIALLAWKGNVGPRNELPPFLWWFDAWVAGGAIARGNPLGPAAVGLVLTAVITWAIWPLRSDRITATTFNYLGVLSMSGAVAIAMFAQPASAGWAAILIGMAKVAGTVFLTLILRRLLLLVMAEAVFDLMSIWLLFSTLFVVLPRVITVRRWQEIALFGALLLATFLWAHATRMEIEVMSVRSGGMNDRLPSEQLTTCIEVQGQAGFPPYLLGLVAAWGIAEFIAVLGIQQWSASLTIAVPAVIYFAVSTLWTANVLKDRFALGAWKVRLNQRHQVMVGFLSDDEMRVHLDALRQRLLRRQTLWQATIVALAVILMPRPVPTVPLPAALFVVSVAAFAAFEGHAFLRQLRNLSLGGAYVPREAFDLSALPEPEEDLDFWDRVRRVMKTRLAITIGVVALILKFAGTIIAAWKLMTGEK